MSPDAPAASSPSDEATADLPIAPAKRSERGAETRGHCGKPEFYQEMILTLISFSLAYLITFSQIM